MNVSDRTGPRPGYINALPVRGRISRPRPKGLEVVNLGFNELPYGPTPKVAEAIAETGHNPNLYGSPGCDDLRAALGARNGLDPATIICGNGSEELIDVIGRNFARPGDEILFSAYGYIQFYLTANRVGATPVKAAERGLATDIDALLAAVTPRTRVLFLANPNNPTGTMVPLEDLRRLNAELRGDVVLVLDLAYGEFAGIDYCAAVHALATGSDRVIVTRTFSKAFGLAGLRVGWAQAPEWMMPGFYAARGMGSVNRMAQMAALAALEDFDIAMARVAEQVAERDRVSAAMGRIGMSAVTSHTNFLMATIDGHGPEVTEALVQFLFDDGGFIVNRTREAGLEHYLRVSMGLPDQNDRLIACMERFAARL